MLLKSDMSNRKKRAHLEHCLSHQYTIIVHGNCLWKLMIHHAAKHLFVSFTHHDCTGNDVPYSPSRASGVGFSGAGENPTACHHHRRRWYVKPQVSSWAQNPNLKKCDLKRPGWVNQIQIRYRFFWDSTWQLAEAIRVHRFRLQWIPSWNPCPAIRQCSSFPVSLNDRRVYMVYPHSWWCACCLISLFSPRKYISASSLISLMFVETPNKPRFVSVAQKLHPPRFSMRTPRLSLHIRRSGKS